MKVLIIGLDGATWDVFDDFLLDHRMPNLKKLKSGGCSGVLQSTDPPVTPAAWTTCITGCQPSTHGVAGFQEYSFKENRLTISTSKSCLVPNIWQELSNQGYKVASINVPWTYPCQEVNGIIVAGFGCPGPKSQFTYPSDFKQKLLKHIPDYEIRADWDWSAGDNFAKFEKNVERVERSFDQRLEAAKLVSEKTNWDVMMVQFQDIDLIEHRIWSYLDKNTRDKYVPQRDRLFQAFEKLDRVIGALLDLVSSEDSMVVVVSDHGHGKRIGDIRPNTLLYQWGYLKLQGRLKSKIKRKMVRWRRKLNSLLFSVKQSKTFDTKRLNVDLKQSKAIVMHLAVNGHVYINVKGRQPFGCVERGAEYDYIIEDLRQRFAEAVDPHTGEPLFSKVATPAELYGISEIDLEKFGDLVLVPSPGFYLRLSGSRSSRYIKMLPEHSLKGIHCYEGIYIFSGKNIKASDCKQTHLVNIAPTVYAVLGAKLPRYMDGRILSEFFSKEIKVDYQGPEEQVHMGAAKKQELSELEQAAIAKRLSELGYLE